MAKWTATADFNGLSDGDLPGQSGGSGWSAAWANNTAGTNFDVQGTTVFEGAKAVVNSTNANSEVERVATTGADEDDTPLWFSFRRSTNTGMDCSVNPNRASGNACFTVRMDASGNIVTDHQFGTATIVTGYSTNTWYTVYCKINVGSFTYDVYVYTGSSGGAGTLAGSTTGRTWFSPGIQPNFTVLKLARDNGGAASYYVDRIDITSPFVEPVAKRLLLMGVGA